MRERTSGRHDAAPICSRRWPGISGVAQINVEDPASLTSIGSEFLFRWNSRLREVIGQPSVRRKRRRAEVARSVIV